MNNHQRLKEIKKIALPALVVCCIAAFAACQSLRAVFKEPVLSLDSVEIADISFTGVDFICNINVENSNPLAIPFPRIGWEFFLNGNLFTTGKIAEGTNIKAYGTSTIRVPVRLEYVEVFNTFKSLKGTTEANYTIAVDAQFTLPLLAEKRWRFEHDGVVPVLQMPKLSSPSMKIDKVEISGVQLLCSVNVENPNIFPLPAPTIDYNYLVNDNSLIRSALVSPGPIAAGAAVPFVWRLSIKYADLLQGILNQKELPSLLSLKPDFKIPAFQDANTLLDIAGSLPIPKVPSARF